jgi:NAD(P)-dependent dehydrogenase (short-subunit alcohol dehydrogenase family)
MFAEKGAKVAILDLPTSKGEEVAKSLGGSFFAVDVMDAEGTEQALNDAVATIGALHIAVNTAGGGRLQAAHMANNEPEDDERGVIIDTASIAAFEGQIGQVAYTAAKAGIAGMALTMARDLGSLGIRVVAVAPSLFSTGITEMIPDEMAAGLTKDAAFPKRMGRPEEYGRLAVAIVETPMLNGSTIRLDAGQRFAPK